MGLYACKQRFSFLSLVFWSWTTVESNTICASFQHERYATLKSGKEKPNGNEKKKFEKELRLVWINYLSVERREGEDRFHMEKKKSLLRSPRGQCRRVFVSNPNFRSC